jgi:hypothetical protein
MVELNSNFVSVDDELDIVKTRIPPLEESAGTAIRIY